MMQLKQMGVCADLISYALVSNTPAPTPTIPPPISLRPLVPLGSEARSWRAKQWLEAAQIDWQETQEIIAPAPDVEMEAWEIAQILDEMRVSPPLAVFPVEMVVTGVRRGEPHRASLDEVDYELFESLRGEL